MRSPVEERGSSWRKTSKSCQLGMTFSMPMTEISTGGSVRHMRPLPSDSTTQIAAGLGHAEVRAADRHRRAEELAPQMRARHRGQRLRLIRKLGYAQRAHEQLADLGAVLVDGRHQDVRRVLAGQLDDQLGQVGLGRADAGVFERGVQPDLVGGQRLDLDHLARAVALHDPRDDRSPPRVARPMDLPARALHRRLQLEQIAVQVAQRALLDRAAGLAQASQSGSSPPQPRAWRGSSGWPCPYCGAAAYSPAHRGRFRERVGGFSGDSLMDEVALPVDARISARWTVPTPAR